MSSSREVNAMRKSGNLDEAYQMALELMKHSAHDVWHIRAIGWCLVDLIKRDIKSNNKTNINHYVNQLKSLAIPNEDQILSEQRIYTLKLCDPVQQEINKAKDLSKVGKHYEAISIYRNIINNGGGTADIHLSLAWELYRVSKGLIDQKPPNYNHAKRYINDYFSLIIEKPSLIHSLILRNALEIFKHNKLNLVSFIQLWGVENFQLEDYESFITSEGRKLPSLVESTLLNVLKEAVLQKNITVIDRLSEFLDECILKFSDNIWLKMRKAQALLVLGKYEEAYVFAKEVVKNKSNESWAWGLLSDVFKPDQKEQKIACYCKALLCAQDLNFVAKLKISLAQILVERKAYVAAKTEIEEVIEFKKANEQKLPEEALLLMEQPWYSEVDKNKSNRQFYIEHSSFAEDLLYEDLPWVKANLGDIFMKERKDKKPKKTRNIFVETKPFPMKANIDEAKISSLSSKEFGDPILVKYYYDDRKNLQIVSVKVRNGEKLDIFTPMAAVVDNVNFEKNIMSFLVDKNINGRFSFDKSSFSIGVGRSINVFLYQYTNKDRRSMYSTVKVEQSNVEPDNKLVKNFESIIDRVPSFAFTEDNYFIPAYLVEKNNLAVGDQVRGKVILNYDKKKSEWGWKVFEIEKVSY